MVNSIRNRLHKNFHQHQMNRIYQINYRIFLWKKKKSRKSNSNRIILLNYFRILNLLKILGLDLQGMLIKLLMLRLINLWL